MFRKKQQKEWTNDKINRMSERQKKLKTERDKNRKTEKAKEI